MFEKQNNATNRKKIALEASHGKNATMRGIIKKIIHKQSKQSVFPTFEQMGLEAQTRLFVGFFQHIVCPCMQPRTEQPELVTFVAQIT